MGALESRWGPGRARHQQGSGRDVPPGRPQSPCAPAGASRSPTIPALERWAPDFHSRPARTPPIGGPGEASGTHAVSLGLGGLSPASSRPFGVREWEPPIAPSSRLRCALPCSAARRSHPDPGRGGGGGREEGWGRGLGGDGGGGSPGSRSRPGESRRKDGWRRGQLLGQLQSSAGATARAPADTPQGDADAQVMPGPGPGSGRRTSQPGSP